MVIRRRIQRVRKQSRIATPTRSLWFSSNESLINQSQTADKRSLRNDRTSIYNDEYIRYGSGNSDFRKTKQECTFVVDWQLSDAF